MQNVQKQPTLPESVVIVGGGLAGFSVARELRRLGYAGGIDLVDRQGWPYDRPPLSKHYLSGTYDRQQLLLVPPQWYRDNEVSVHRATVARLDPAEQSVVLQDGTALRADTVVLATGGTPRALPIPGAELPGIGYLRVAADADRLREALQPGTALVIIGAGLIGAEVASTAVERGVRVSLVDPVETPLESVVGADVAAQLRQLQRDHGVDVITAGAVAIGQSAPSARFAVQLDDRSSALHADTVLIAIGIEVDRRLSDTAGVEFDGAILVDAGQQTSNPWVYAVGDAARRTGPEGVQRPGQQRSGQHWEAASRSGETAAAAILGTALPDHGAAWFWSDRHGKHVEVVGSMAVPGRTVVRWVDHVPVMAFRIDDDGLLRGFVCIDGGLSGKAARRIIDRQIRVDTAELADPAVELKKLVRPRRSPPG